MRRKAGEEPSADERLDSFLEKFDPPVAALASACLERVRRLVPGSVELVYDAYNALSIGFGTSERLGDCFVHVAVYPRHVNLGFNRGAVLSDPGKLLQGTGSQVRHIRIDDPSRFEEAEVARLVLAAAALAGHPGSGKRRIVVKKVYAKQRPRRPSR